MVGGEKKESLRGSPTATTRERYRAIKEPFNLNFTSDFNSLLMDATINFARCSCFFFVTLGFVLVVSRLMVCQLLSRRCSFGLLWFGFDELDLSMASNGKAEMSALSMKRRLTDRNKKKRKSRFRLN